MSIFKNMMSALGFSGEDEETETQPYTAENITNACAPTENKPIAKNEAPRQEKSPMLKNDDLQLPDSLLDVLVEILNRSLPDYVVASLDKEAEKKYLFNQLGTPFKKFVEEVNAQARTQISQKWKADQDFLKKEVETARIKVKDLEEQRNTMQSAQLSAERQKRAVTEKMHELEARIATLEAEREQFILENKSLVNKLKVANVHQEELDNSREEHNRLMTELNKQKIRIVELEKQQDESQKLKDELEQLRGQLARAQSTPVVSPEIEEKYQQALQQLSEKETETKALVQKLNEQTESNKALQQQLDELLEQQRNQPQEVDIQAIESLKSELEQANTMLSALRNQRQELLAQIETLKQYKETSVPVVEKSVETPVVKSEEKKEEPAQESKVITFGKKEEKKTQEKAAPKKTSVSVEPVKAVKEEPVAAPVVIEEPAASPVFDDFDAFDDNWLIPTRPDTPEMIAKRKEEERRKQEEEERLAAEQKKAQQVVDSSQMSLW